MALNKPRPLGMCCGTTFRRGLAYMSACIIHLQSLSGHLTSAMTRSSSKSACPLLKALEFILLPSCISMAWGRFLNQLASSCCVHFRTLCPKASCISSLLQSIWLARLLHTVQSLYAPVNRPLPASLLVVQQVLIVPSHSATNDRTKVALQQQQQQHNAAVPSGIMRSNYLSEIELECGPNILIDGTITQP